MRLTIAMATGGLQFSGDSLEKKALGGSETAFIYVAKALAKRGHTVHAFCNCSQAGIYDEVGFYPFEQFPSQAGQLPYDIIISSRWPEVLRTQCNDGLRVLWCHDTLEDPNRFMGNLYRTDLVMLLSKFHRENYRAKCEEIDSFSWLTTNAVDFNLCWLQSHEATNPEDIVNSIVSKPRNPKKLLYTSRPERGLHYLLGDVFPELVKKIPDIEIHFCNYPLDGMKVPDHVTGITQFALEQARKFPKNIFNLGHLTKAQLYSEMADASLLVYPTSFPEISFIGGIEAQACGLPIISTNDFALPETIHPDAGVLIDGKPPSAEYVRNFVEATLRVLGDKDLQVKMGKAGIEHVRSKYTWDLVAESWERKFVELLEERYKSRTQDVAKQLQRHGDFVAASTIAECGRVPTQSFPLPTDGAQVIAAVRESMPRLEAAAQILNAGDVEPRNILDYGCGYVCFGFVAAKYFPTAEVVLTDIQEGPLNQQRANLERLNLPKVFVRDISSALRSTQYHVIYLGNILEFQTTPSSFLQSLRDNLTDDGYFLISCEAGPLAAKAGVEATDGKRLWNLTHREFRDLFQECADFKCLFVELGKNEVGESYGHWIALVSKKGLKGGHANFQKIDLKKKRLLTRPYESLSTLVISNEQEDSIGTMLKSVAPISDEIIVVDTRKERVNTTDRTMEIAKKYGAKIVEADFNNFSQARNVSKDHATGNWCLVIDTDEKLMGVENLRQYLSGTVFEGYAIKQVHFTVDGLNGTFDIPVRLFRNREHYRAVGLIHEHFERQDRMKYDDPISPRMMLPDVDIAHFGYLNEDVRKKKCSNRNMELLKRATLEEPDRKLTWTLVIRDYLNMVKWGANESPVIERGSQQHQLLEHVVDTFHQHFHSQDEKYYSITFPMYQEALMILGKLGLPYKDHPHQPFEIRLSLTASMGGFQGDSPAPESLWFLDYQEFRKHYEKKMVQLGLGLGVLRVEEVGDALTKDLSPVTYGAPPVAADVLSKGIGAFRA